MWWVLEELEGAVVGSGASACGHPGVWLRKRGLSLAGGGRAGYMRGCIWEDNKDRDWSSSPALWQTGECDLGQGSLLAGPVSQSIIMFEHLHSAFKCIYEVHLPFPRGQHRGRRGGWGSAGGVQQPS